MLFFNYKLLIPALVLPCMMAAPLYGQPVTDTLSEISVTATRVQTLQPDLRSSFAAGQLNKSFDTTIRKFYNLRSVAELITDQSPVFIRSYGVNGMATLTFRGASAAQSAVLWNGVPIANPSLGMADVSLLRSGLFDEISLQYGGSSALFGSGNVGGALLLQSSTPEFSSRKHLSLTLGGGSFGHYNASLKTLLENRQLRVKWNFFYETAQNNFPYRDALGHRQRMTNAALRGWGSLFSLDYNLDKKSPPGSSREMLSLKLWYQDYDREIPPALFEQGSVKRQNDRSFRSLLYWQKTRERSSFFVRFAYLRDLMHYQDGSVLPNERNQVADYYFSAGWRWRIDRPDRKLSAAKSWEHHLLLSLPVQYAVMAGAGNHSAAFQIRPALLAAYDLARQDGRYQVDLMLRQQWENNRRPILLPGLGLKAEVWTHAGRNSRLQLRMRGSIQRSFRAPTLNELYFQPGGNEALRPERGWNEELGWQLAYYWQRDHESRANRWCLEQSVSFFNRNITDWIYWLGGAIWTPHNLAKVHSRGVETDHLLSFERADIKWELGVKTAYVLSTTVASYLPGDGSIGHQIPYTPRYNVRMNLGLRYKRFFINYNHGYTGYRFITVDESQALPPYQCGNLQVLYGFRIGNYTFRIAGQLLNVFNERYEVVNGRPMPGRHFLINFQTIL